MPNSGNMGAKTHGLNTPLSIFFFQLIKTGNRLSMEVRTVNEVGKGKVLKKK